MKKIALLVFLACCHENGCEGNDAERYARLLKPDMRCTDLHYGAGTPRNPDSALCSDLDETWYCRNGQCRVLGAVVRVERADRVVP